MCSLLMGSCIWVPLPIGHVSRAQWGARWQAESRKPGWQRKGCRWKWTRFFVADRMGKCHRRKSSSLQIRALKLKAHRATVRTGAQLPVDTQIRSCSVHHLWFNKDFITNILGENITIFCLCGYVLKQIEKLLAKWQRSVQIPIIIVISDDYIRNRTFSFKDKKNKELLASKKLKVLLKVIIVAYL